MYDQRPLERVRWVQPDRGMRPTKTHLTDDWKRTLCGRQIPSHAGRPHYGVRCVICHKKAYPTPESGEGE
jgi:hypothetical protein